MLYDTEAACKTMILAVPVYSRITNVTDRDAGITGVMKFF